MIKSHQIYELKYEHTTSSNFVIILKHKNSYQILKDLRNNEMYNRELPSGVSINSVTILVENASESGGS